MADRIVAFAGSLRRGSFNRALIHAAAELAPDGMTIEPRSANFHSITQTWRRRAIRPLWPRVTESDRNRPGTASSPAAARPRACPGAPAARAAGAKVHERFDSGLRLKDEGTRKVLGDLLTRFGRWIARERAAAEAERQLATTSGLSR